MDIKRIDDLQRKLLGNIRQVILGKDDVIETVIMALICKGHILIEDVPGTGKTILAKCVAKSLSAEFRRIQFTPDMLPSDVTGMSIFNQASREFEFRPGPIFANIILADEINRATPKTQSALLEAMEETQVTVDGITHHLPNFMIVMATQNPIEYEGTFSLPEAQLDRFLIRLKIGYPQKEVERKILESQKISHPIESVQPVATIAELMAVQKEVKAVFVSDKVEKYIIDIITKTRTSEDIYLGASPRGSLGLYRLGQCSAAFEGREFVIPDDIKKVAPYALSHRIIPSPSTRLADFQSEEMIEDLIAQVPVPGG